MSEPAQFQAVVNRANLQPDAARSELQAMASENLVITLGGKTIGRGVSMYTAGGWSAVASNARETLASYHRQFPLRKGAPKEELRSRLRMTPQVFNNALPKLQQDGVLMEEGTLVRLSDHRPELSGGQSKLAQAYLKSLEADPYSPPTDSPIDADVLNLLADEGKVVQVSETVAFSASAYEHMVDGISTYIRENGEITVPT